MVVRSMLLFLFVVLGTEAFANNLFIPNYYRNRREPNQMSAIGWSDRHEAELAYEMKEGKETTNNVKNEESKSTSPQGHVFYRTPVNLNIEAQFIHQKEKEKSIPVTGPDDESKLNSYHLGLGYELENVPVAFGASFTRTKTETDLGAGGSSESELDIPSLGTGYHLGDGKYLGVGYSRFRIDSSTSSEDIVDILALGIGKLYGDRKKPLAANEFVATYLNEDHTQNYGLGLSGLYNGIESLQIYGAFSYGWQNGEDGGDDMAVKLGVDYVFSMFYVGPEIEWSENNFDARNTSDREDMNYSVEAGYRDSVFEVFVRYESDESERKAPAFAFKTEEEEETWALGASYKF